MEPHVNTRDHFCVSFKCMKLINKEGFFGTSDPFLVISRSFLKLFYLSHKQYFFALFFILDSMKMAVLHLCGQAQELTIA